MRCSSCGHENRAGAAFCSDCGAALPAQVTCPSCNTANPRAQRFCDGCGEALGGTTPPRPDAAALRAPAAVADGRYEVRRGLGKGAKEVVFLAHDTRLDRDVALAPVKTDGLDDAGLARIRREARAGARLTLLLAVVALTVPSARGRAATSDSECMACHSSDDIAPAGVAGSPALYEKSIHAAVGLTCTDCHQDLADAEMPHAEKLAPAKCDSCHDEAKSKLDQSAHAGFAGCADCHGGHGIVASGDPGSATSRLRVSEACGGCHRVNAPAATRADPRTRGIYFDRIHGWAVAEGGLAVAPSCVTCHGSHEILGADDERSRVYKTRVPESCGTCHQGILAPYRADVHGTTLLSGNLKAPACADCHAPHTAQPQGEPLWRIEVAQQCGGCHEKATRTYRASFHGQVTTLGFTLAAACSDCHRAHHVFPQSDPRSTVSPEHLVQTCSGCHPDSTPRFALFDPHADAENPTRSPLVYYTSLSMKLLLIGVFSFFGFHTILWVPRSFRERLDRDRRRRRAEAAAREPRPEEKSNGEPHIGR